MHLSNQSLLVILFVGIVAGWLAGRVMEGGGFGLIGDLLVGLIGAFIGDWLLPRLGIRSRRRNSRRHHECLYRCRGAVADFALAQRRLWLPAALERVVRRRHGAALQLDGSAPSGNAAAGRLCRSAPNQKKATAPRSRSARSLSTQSAPAKSPRLEINFASQFNLIGWFRPSAQNFHFRFSEKYAYLPASRSTKRGASANRHERWCGMRWTFWCAHDETR